MVDKVGDLYADDNLHDITTAQMFEIHNEENVRLDVKPTTSLEKVKLMTKAKNKIWWDNVYSVEAHERAYKRYASEPMTYQVNGAINDSPLDIDAFDAGLWVDFTTAVDGYRKEVHSALLEYGVSDVDAHFLSVKFTISMVKKFRNRFFKAFHAEKSRENYHRTFFRPCVIALLKRLEKMMPKNSYIYSKVAAETSSYRRDAAWECAKLLEDDTSVTLLSKLLI